MSDKSAERMEMERILREFLITSQFDAIDGKNDYIEKRFKKSCGTTLAIEWQHKSMINVWVVEGRLETIGDFQGKLTPKDWVKEEDRKGKNSSFWVEIQDDVPVEKRGAISALNQIEAFYEQRILRLGLQN